MAGAILGIASSFLVAPPVAADYTIGTGPYAFTIGGATGRDGIYWDEGSPLIGNEGPETWDGWLGHDEFDATWVGCGNGTLKPCILYLDDGDTINGTSCSTPQAGLWAATYMMT